VEDGCFAHAIPGQIDSPRPDFDGYCVAVMHASDRARPAGVLRQADIQLPDDRHSAVPESFP
jgi:hypothetical protein